MSNETEEKVGDTRTRRIIFHAFKRSGKWYSSGFAYINPNDNYFESDRLLKDIDETNDQLVKGALSSKEFYVVVDEIEDEVGQPFVTRLMI